MKALFFLEETVYLCMVLHDENSREGESGAGVGAFLLLSPTTVHLTVD